MWNNVIATVLSLLAFIGGLRVMRRGFEGMAEGRLTKWIERLVRTPSRGIVTGAITTAVLQSSAALTAITVGLVAAESLTFRNGLAVVLGANVGSTFTPQILNLNLWGLVLPAFAVGMLFIVLQKPRLRHPGEALIGFACIFIALQALKTSLHPLTASQLFAGTLQYAGSHLLTAAAIGCLASAAVQSSTATTLIAMALAADGLIPVSGGIAIVLGANVGTCFTSVIAAIGQNRASQQVALAHVLLNVGGVIACMPMLVPFSAFVEHLSQNPSQAIANANTLFNVACTLAVWPWTGRFASMIERLLPNQLGA